MRSAKKSNHSPLNATRGRAAGTTDYGQARAHREITARHGVRWRRWEGIGKR